MEVCRTIESVYTELISKNKNLKILIHVFANNDVFGGPTNLKGNTQEECLIKAARAEFDEFWKGKEMSNYYPIDTIGESDAASSLRRAIPYKKIGCYIASIPSGGAGRIDYIFVPAPKLPWTKMDLNTGRKVFMFDEDKDVVAAKMRMIFAAAAEGKYDVLLTGYGWGCGSFACPADDMKTIWKDEMKKLGRAKFKIIFCDP